MFETGRIKNLLSTTLSKGNALVQEANLSNSNLKTFTLISVHNFGVGFLYINTFFTIF